MSVFFLLPHDILAFLVPFQHYVTQIWNFPLLQNSRSNEMKACFQLFRKLEKTLDRDRIMNRLFISN